MKIFLTLILLMLATPLSARPVSYAESWTLIQLNDEIENTIYVHYSPEADYSIGPRIDFMREGKGNLYTVEYNRLLKRWNMPEAQANFYLLTAAGLAHQSNKTRGAVWGGIELDYETQRIYMAYENRLLYADTIEKAIFQRARLGFAPYVGDFCDLHTWLMIQVDYHPSLSSTWVWTPMVRFFKGNKMVEIGYSSNKKLMFNWIVRF
jgi:hypothetical protein